MDRAVELNPYDPAVFITRGGIYREIAKYEEAIKEFDKALELDSSNAEAYCRRGIAYLYLNQYEKAIEDMEYGLKISPSLEQYVKDYLDEAKEKLQKK